MHPALWGDRFQAGSYVHGLVLALILVGCGGLAMLGRAAHRRQRELGQGLDLALATLLATYWIAIKLRNLLPHHLGWDHSLPLHICDVAMVSAVIGLATWRRMPRNLLFFWGLGLCPTALLLPSLYLGPRYFDFWVYWLSHGAITAVAVYELAVRGYRPRCADWCRIVAINLLYTSLVMCLDGRLSTNYGFVGPQVYASEILAFGDWPARVPRLFATSCAIQLLMALSPLLLSLRLVRPRAAQSEAGDAGMTIPPRPATLPMSHAPATIASAA